jgi:hypothetical protein
MMANMKANLFALVMVAALPLVALRAAEARRFEGLNLAELKETQQLGKVPEIYEREPNARRFQLRKAVVQIPVGAGWVAFNAELNVSYFFKVPGENAASYFGPIGGDAFELFKLEERFITRLRESSAPEADVEYRFTLMMRTGNEKLRERALRIMTAALAPEVRPRVSYLGRIKELTDGLEGNDVAPVRAAMVQLEKSIEDSKVTLPDSAYSSGNDELARQGKLLDWMKPGVAVPDAAWGEPSNGMRAAAVFSDTEPKPDEEISVWVLVENASDKEIRFASSDVMQDAFPKITRADGTEFRARHSWYTGLTPIRHHKLRPGERLTLAKKTLVFEDKDNAKSPGFGSNRVAAGPGEYRVRYENILGTTSNAKGEWCERLITGETRIIVAGEAKATVAKP